MSFTGVYQHQIDAKGRTSLPSRFREVLAAQGADKLFVTTDLFDGCLQAYGPAQWAAFTQKGAAVAPKSANSQKVAPAQKVAAPKAKAATRKRASGSASPSKARAGAPRRGRASVRARARRAAPRRRS